MKTKKLTTAQLACLNLLATKGSSDFYDLMRVGAQGATTKKLVGIGLIELHESKSDGKSWSITQNGRDALASGRYPIE